MKLFLLGGYLLAERRCEEARGCYVRALEIDPEYELAKKRLADVERILALNSEFAEKEPEA